MTNQWKFEFGAAFIVPPCRGLEENEIADRVSGGVIEINLLPLEILSPLFLRGENMYNLGIVFQPENGEQSNQVRTLVRSIALDRNEQKAQAATQLAHRLASVTRGNSKIGLLIIIKGSRGAINRVVAWKFPAEDALQAEAKGQNALVRHIENAFSTESGYLKAVMFGGNDSRTSFLMGKAEDRQSKNTLKQVADFWMEEFLLAQPETTDQFVSGVLGKYIRKAIDSSDDLSIRSAIISAANVLKVRERRITMQNFAADYLPEDARQHFIAQISDPRVLNSEFRVNREILDSAIKYESIILDNDFVLTGPSDKFAEFVEISEIKGGDGRVSISVQGVIKTRKLKSRK